LEFGEGLCGLAGLQKKEKKRQECRCEAGCHPFSVNRKSSRGKGLDCACPYQRAARRLICAAA
jgi:hypothetical protein